MAILKNYVKQLQKSAQVFQRLVAKHELWRPIIERREQLEKALQPIEEMHSHFVKRALEFQSQLETLINPAFTAFIESSKKLPKKTQDALLVLGRHGWYLDLEMALSGLWSLEQELTDGNVEGAERALVEYFRERAPEISKIIATTYPHRAKIIYAAFKAHERGEYELSIPVLLAQADGICQELIGVQLFKKRNNRPETASYVDDVAIDTFRSALLHPLAQPFPISYSSKQRGVDFDELNRHQVLHGESVDYGTEVNSLKTISLVNYVVQVLKRERLE